MKLNIIGCGGAGINCVKSFEKSLSNIGSGFATPTFSYIDTSDNNIKAYDYKEEDFFLIKDKSANGGVINGSGGERTTNFNNIENSVPEFLDKKKFNSHKLGEYYIIVTSTGGGSGNMIAWSIAKNFLSKNNLDKREAMPFIVVLIGDDNDMKKSENTIKVLNTFQNLAISRNSVIPCIYRANRTTIINGKKNEPTKISLAAAEEKVNKDIEKIITGISLFLSSENKDIDAKDMEFYLTPHMQKSLELKPTLTTLMFTNDHIDFSNSNIVPLLCTTITAGSVPGDTNYTLLSHKVGNVILENPVGIYNGKFPLHLLQVANELENEVKVLNETVANFKNIQNSISRSEYTSNTGSVLADEDGIVM